MKHSKHVPEKRRKISNSAKILYFAKSKIDAFAEDSVRENFTAGDIVEIAGGILSESVEIDFASVAGNSVHIEFLQREKTPLFAFTASIASRPVGPSARAFVQINCLKQTKVLSSYLILESYFQIEKVEKKLVF